VTTKRGVIAMPDVRQLSRRFLFYQSNPMKVKYHEKLSDHRAKQRAEPEQDSDSCADRAEPD